MRTACLAIALFVASFPALPLHAQNEPTSSASEEQEQQAIEEALRLSLQGFNFYREGKYAEAVAVVEEALAVRERVLGKEHPLTLTTASNLAGLHMMRGRYGEAEPLILRVLEVRKRVLGEEHPSTLASVNNLATIYLRQGRFGEAEPLFLRAMQIDERVLFDDDPITRDAVHPIVLASANNLAGLYESQGRYGEAEPLFLWVLEESRLELGEDHPDTLNTVNSLALVYERQGRYDEAERLYVQAQEISERVLGEEHPSTLFSVNNLASLYTVQGRYGEAEPLLVRALEVSERVLGEEHPDTLILVSTIAGLYWRQGRYSEAEPLMWRTLASGLRVLPENHPNLAMHYAELGSFIDAKTGDPRQSTLFFKQAVNALQGVRQNMAELDSSTHRSFLDKHSATYLELQKLLIEQGRFAEAEQVGRMFKDVEYTAFVRGARDAELGEQLALNTRERDWEAQLSGWLETPNRLAGELSALRKKKREGGGLTALEERQLADLDAAYGAAYKEFFAQVTAWTSADQTFDSEAIERETQALALEESRAVRRLVGSIGSDVGLLQAVAFEDSLHLFFITGEAFVHEEVPVSRRDLFATIFEARQLIDEGRNPGIANTPGRAAELQAPLGELYQWLVAPIEDELQAAGTKTLMLNLQGQIRYLPFAALWDGEAYLTEKLHLALYTPAANTRYDEPSALSRAQGFGLSNATEGFSPLPSVPKELNYVIGSAKEPGILAGEYVLNENFTRSSFEEGLADPAPVVHLATHFQIKPGDEASSYLVLGDGSRISVAAINRSYKYDFEGVELLTLSACETALGAESTGMEIEGFGALAQNKGAASVVASLWKVSDDAAPELMRSFYSGMVQDGLTKAGALQRAQLELIASKKFSDPFYWAPFVIMGNWR